MPCSPIPISTRKRGCDPMDRRTAMQSIGSGIAGLGLGFLFLSSSKSATATLAVTSMSISDDSITTRDGTISDVQISISGSWDYSVPNDKDPAEWSLQLLVIRDNESAVIDSTTGSAMYLSSDGDYTLSGSVLSTDLYSVGDFEEGTQGATKDTTLTFRVVFEVLNSDGERLATARKEASGITAVTNEDYNASEFGSLSGSGELTLQG